MDPEIGLHPCRLAGDLTPTPDVRAEHDLHAQLADLRHFPFDDRVDLLLTLDGASTESRPARESWRR